LVLYIGLQIRYIYIWDLFCESVDKALDSDLPLFLVGD
jgi:hypothetical protein